MAHINFPKFDDFNLPIIMDVGVQDAGKWMSDVEYKYLVEMIEGRDYGGLRNIQNYITNEFRDPVAFFFTTNIDNHEAGSNWKHLMVLEAHIKDEGIYVDELYRVGFLVKDLPKGKELRTLSENMKTFDAKYYYALKDATYIKKGWLGYVSNYKGLLDRLDEWWITFGGGV